MNHGPLRVAYRPRPQTKKYDSNHDACSVREPRVIICIIFLLASGTDCYMLHAEYMEICGSIRDVVLVYSGTCIRGFTRTVGMSTLCDTLIVHTSPSILHRHHSLVQLMLCDRPAPLSSRSKVKGQRVFPAPPGPRSLGPRSISLSSNHGGRASCPRVGRQGLAGDREC